MWAWFSTHIFCSLCLSLVLCAFPSSPLNLRSFFVVIRLSRLLLASACLLFHGIRARGLRISVAEDSSKQKTPNLRKRTVGNKRKEMDRNIASSLPTEKLDRSNYASWSYKMHQYLLGHGYWSYAEGANVVAPDSTQRDFSVWEQGASRVLYYLASYVSNTNV